MISAVCGRSGSSGDELSVMFPRPPRPDFCFADFFGGGANTEYSDRGEEDATDRRLGSEPACEEASDGMAAMHASALRVVMLPRPPLPDLRVVGFLCEETDKEYSEREEEARDRWLGAEPAWEESSDMEIDRLPVSALLLPSEKRVSLMCAAFR